jgi:hypothetical protein
MRLAGADVVPFRASGLAETVTGYTGQVKALAASRRDSIIEINRRIGEGVYTAISDPRQPLVPPARQAEPPFLNFAPLENAAARLRESASRYDAAYDSLSAGDGSSLEKPAARSVNGLMLQLEQTLLQEDGLPGRPWYRHYLYAPGLYTGYAVKTLPAIRAAIEQGFWPMWIRRLLAPPRSGESREPDRQRHSHPGEGPGALNLARYFRSIPRPVFTNSLAEYQMRLHLFAATLAILVGAPALAAQQDSSLVTLERLFTSDDFSPDFFGPARWLQRLGLHHVRARSRWSGA